MTKQDLIQWFNALATNAIKGKVYTGMVNGKIIDATNDKQNALQILDIIEKHNKEFVEIPSKTQLEIFAEIVEQCASGKFRSINVGTQKRRDAVVSIWKYIKANL